MQGGETGQLDWGRGKWQALRGASLAQLVEHSICNRKVASSILAAGSILPAFAYEGFLRGFKALTLGANRLPSIVPEFAGTARGSWHPPPERM